MFAVSSPGHCEAVRLLLSRGVHMDPIDHRGAPLHMAIAKDRVEAVKLLLEHGADVSLSIPLSVN
jgi:ankyrin repeat protein